jgi:hypothetical protein
MRLTAEDHGKRDTTANNQHGGYAETCVRPALARQRHLLTVTIIVARGARRGITNSMMPTFANGGSSLLV